MWFITPSRLLIAIALTLVLVGQTPAAPALRDGFEGPESSWRDAGGDAQYRITAHSRVADVSHSGRGSEQLRIVANGGTSVYVAYEISPAPVIGELSVSLWVKADRPGLQILARAVVPRSKDPATGQPLTMLIAGSGYTQVGNWQQLRLDNLPAQFERQLRVLRVEHGPAVDGHEAYIDRVMLNAYGGPGTTNLWIDDFELNGVIGTAAAPNQPAVKPTAAQGANPFAERLPGADRTLPDESTRPGAARLSGSNLMVGDQPFFPRLLEYRGEPLALIRELGFNGIWMTTPPSAALLQEAGTLGLRIVSPPPSIRELEKRVADGPAAGIDSQFDPILAWDLGSMLATKEFPINKRWSQLLRTADPRSRPLVCGADCDLWSYSRNVDVLWISRAPLGSSLGMTAYLTWLRQRPQWARGGTPAWTMIQTQPSDRLVEQAGLVAGKPLAIAWQDEQFRLLVHSALAAGAHGLCFCSATPLDASDPATRRRAMLLELTNLELDLIEPWCAGGSFVTGASGDDTNMGAAVMETDRARVVLPLPNGPFNQFALPLPYIPEKKDPRYIKKKTSIRANLGSTPPPGAAYSHIPGVPESNQAYELSPVAFHPMASKRVAGGVRLLFSDDNRESLVVFTQDSTVVANLTRRKGRVSARALELTRQLESLHLKRVEDVYALLEAKGHVPDDSKKWLEAARGYLKQAEIEANAHSDQRAYYATRHCDRLLRQVERNCWELTMRPVATSPLATPLASCFDTLPEYWQFMGELASMQRGQNLLPAADFEDLGAALTAWRYFQHPQPVDRQHPQPVLTTSVKPDSDTVHGGKYSLRLEVAPTDPKEPPAQVETAPMWLSSAPVRVDAGKIVLIHGWVNIPKRIAGSVDGLMIVDSISGEPLAERILQTKDWQEFSLYRAAPRTGPLTVTFALSGLGEAFLDDVSIQIVDRPSATSPTALPATALPTTAAQPVGPELDAQHTARQRSTGSSSVRPRVGPNQIGTMFQKSF